MNIRDILLIIIIIYLIISHSKKNHIENFAVTDDIRAAVKEVYNTDMESVRQLATMSQTLVGNGITGIGIVPIGSIIMWTGNRVTLPSNYKLCDGTTYNGIPTPDLRNKFIIGANYHQDGSTLSSESFNLKMNNNLALRTNIEDGQLTTTGGTKDAIVVEHTHTASSNDVTPPMGITEMGLDYLSKFHSGGDFHRVRTGGVPPYANIGGSHSHTITVNTQGVSGTNKNLPPYYALAFVMRIS